MLNTLVKIIIYKDYFNLDNKYKQEYKIFI